jgi:hypothetical protein
MRRFNRKDRPDKPPKPPKPWKPEPNPTPNPAPAPVPKPEVCVFTADKNEFKVSGTGGGGDVVFLPSIVPCHFPDFVITGDFIAVGPPHVAKTGEGVNFKTCHFHVKPNPSETQRTGYVRCGNALVTINQDGIPAVVVPVPTPTPTPIPEPAPVQPVPTPVPVQPVTPAPTPEPPHVHPTPTPVQPVPVQPTPTPEPQACLFTADKEELGVASTGGGGNAVFRPSVVPCHYPDFVVIGDFIEVSAPHVPQAGEGDTFKTAHFHAKPNTSNEPRVAYIRCGNAEVKVTQQGVPVVVEPTPTPHPGHVHPEPTPAPVQPAPVPVEPTPAPPHIHPEPPHIHPEPTPTPVPVPTGFKSSIRVGDEILIGGGLTSPDGTVTLAVEDWRLVLTTHEGATTLWEQRLRGKLPFRLLLQTDGNLVLYDATNRPLWDAGTVNRAGSEVCIENSGNLIIKDLNGNKIWETGTELSWKVSHHHHHEEVPFGTIRPDTTTPTIKGHHGDEMYNFAVHAQDNIRTFNGNYKPATPGSSSCVRSGGTIVLKDTVDFKELTADGGEIIFEDGANVSYETFQALKGSRIVFRPANKGIRITHKHFTFRQEDKNEFGGGSIFMCEVDIRGKKVRRYIPVAKGPVARDEWIELAEPATDWEVGHEIIVPGTNPGGGVVPGTNLRTMDDHEERTILELSLDRKRIRVRPLEFDHPGCYDRGLGKWINPSIGNMFASIVITSEGDVPYHNMFTGGIKGIVDSVRFEGGSRTGMTLSGDGHVGFKGRYGGTHVHGNDIPGAFKVSNCVYKDVNKWSIVNHGGKGIDFEYNLVVQGKGKSGSLMVSEDGTETGTFAYNMLVGPRGLGLKDGHDRVGVAGTCIWLNGAGVKVIGNQCYGGDTGMTLYNGVNGFHPEPYLGRDCIFFRQPAAARVFGEKNKPGPERAMVNIGGFTAVYCHYGATDGSYVWNFGGVHNARFLYDPNYADSDGWGVRSNRGLRFVGNYFQDCPKHGGAIHTALTIHEDLTREVIGNTGNSLGGKIIIDNVMHYQVVNAFAYISNNDIKGEQEDISYNFLNMWGSPAQMFDMAAKVDNDKRIFVYNTTVEPRGRFELLSHMQLGDWRPDKQILFESHWSNNYKLWREVVVPDGPLNARGMVEVEFNAALFGFPRNDWQDRRSVQRLVKRTDPDEEPDVWEHVAHMSDTGYREGEVFEFAPGTVLRWGFNTVDKNEYADWRVDLHVADVLNLPKYHDLAYANKTFGTSVGGRFAHRHEAIIVPQLKTSVLVPSNLPEGVDPVKWWLSEVDITMHDRAHIRVTEKDSRLGAFRLTSLRGNGNFSEMENFQIWVSDKLEGDRDLVYDSGKRHHPYNEWVFLPPVATTPNGKKITLGDGKERYYFFSRKSPDGKYRFTRKWHEWWDEKPRGHWRYAGGFKFKWTYDPSTQHERVVKPKVELPAYVFEGNAPAGFESSNPDGKPWGRPLVYPIDDDCVPVMTWIAETGSLYADVDRDHLSKRLYHQINDRNYSGFAGYAYTKPGPGRRPLWKIHWWADQVPTTVQIYSDQPGWYLPSHEEYLKSVEMLERAEKGELL